ncbi:hypothetical protein [uncultured Enterococcus sp.]|uniref:nucleoside-diphosphate sugar epimerase/dehydratase n=1 Tax=uncultured Enterococcus sp. TaxID=167972 RepID=UPI002AA68B87|nr:hypothetical protein [uncultured Enterococcus sp.]
MVAIFSATSITVLFEGLILFYGSRRFLLLTYLLTTFLIISSRLIWRLTVEWRNGKRYGHARAKKTLIIGAGEAGRILLSSLSTSTTSDIQVVGFIDDALDKQKIVPWRCKSAGEYVENS